MALLHETQKPRGRCHQQVEDALEEGGEGGEIHVDEEDFAKDIMEQVVEAEDFTETEE